MTTTIGVSLEWFRSAVAYHSSSSSPPSDTSPARGEFSINCPSAAADRESRYSILVVHRKGAKEVRDTIDDDKGKAGQGGETEREKLFQFVVSFIVTRGRYVLTDAKSVTPPSAELNVASPDNGWTGIGIVMDGDTVHHPLLEMCSLFIARKKPAQPTPSSAGSTNGNRIRSISTPRGAQKAASKETVSDINTKTRLRSSCIDLALALINLLSNLPQSVRHSKSVLVVSLPTLPMMLSPASFVSACAFAVDIALEYLHSDANFGIEKFFIVPQLLASLSCMLAPIPMSLNADSQPSAPGEVGMLVFPHGNRTQSPLNLSLATNRVVFFRGSTKSLCAYVMLVKWDGRVGQADSDMGSVSLEFHVADAAGCGGDAIDLALLELIAHAEGDRSVLTDLSPQEKVQLLISLKAARHRMLSATKRSHDKGQTHNFTYVAKSHVKKFPLSCDLVDSTALEMNEQKMNSILAKVAQKLKDTQVDAFVTSGECFAVPALCRAFEQSVAERFSSQLARGSVVVHSSSSAQFHRSEVAAASGCCLFGYQALDGKKNASIVRRAMRLSGAAYFFQKLPRTLQAASPSPPPNPGLLTHYDLLLKSVVETDSWVVMIPRGTPLPTVRDRRIMLTVEPAAKGTAGGGSRRVGASIQLLAVEHGRQRVLPARIPAFQFECDAYSGGEIPPASALETEAVPRVAQLTVSLTKQGEVRIDVLHLDTGAFATSGWTHAIRELAVTDG